MLDVRSRC